MFLCTFPLWYYAKLKSFICKFSLQGGAIKSAYKSCSIFICINNRSNFGCHRQDFHFNQQFGSTCDILSWYLVNVLMRGQVLQPWTVCFVLIWVHFPCLGVMLVLMSFLLLLCLKCTVLWNSLAQPLWERSSDAYLYKVPDVQ